MEINKYSKYEKELSKSVPFFKGLRAMFGALRGSRLVFLLGVLLLVTASVPAIIVPFYIRDITNNITDVDFVLKNALIMLGLYLGHSIFQYLGSIILAKTTEKLTLNLREEIHKKILNLPLSNLSEHDIGEVLSLLTNDIDSINFSLTNNVITMFSNLISIVGSLVSAIIISPILSIFLAIPFVLSLLRTLYISKIMRKNYYSKSKAQARYENKIHEWINAKQVVEAYGVDGDFVKELIDENAVYHQAALKAEKSASSAAPFAHLIQHSCLVIISIMALILIDNSLASVAIYSAFIIYSRRFSEPISDVSVAFSEFSSSFASFSHINEFINLQYEKANEDDKEQIEKIDILEGKNISFSYDKIRKVLDGVSFNSIPNGTLAIIGHTGCGKTTLISLLLSLYQGYEGDIEVNGTNYNDINKVSLQSNFSYVSQDPWIFSGTILENLTYGLDNVDMEVVNKVCEEIGLSLAISYLPHHYEEVISRNTNKLSTGQLQMISVARAIIQNRDFLIMDEPTSNMDFLSEIKIKNALDKFRKGKSTIIIAHRLSTIYSSDLIMLLDDGKVIETGNHQQLLDKKGVYHHLVMSHFVTEESN